MRPPERYGTLTTADGGEIRQTRVAPPAGAYEEFYGGLRDAILLGAPVPVDPRDALETLRVIEAARASAASGAVVPFPGEPRAAPGAGA